MIEVIMLFVMTLALQPWIFLDHLTCFSSFYWNSSVVGLVDMHLIDTADKVCWSTKTNDLPPDVSI